MKKNRFNVVTQEPANATKENQLFNNVSSTMSSKPSGFDGVSANTQVTKLNGGTSNKRVGPSIILKVMAGDVISISTKAWYTGTAQADPTGLDPIKNQLLDLLTAGIVNNNGTHGGVIPLTDISDGGAAALENFLNDQPATGNPKAFLNWMIVDEEFKKVNSSFHSGSTPVQATPGEAVSLYGPTNMTVRRGGWLYVYLSNETNQDVYFDDLVINHKRGPVVEVNDYYPFGMGIVGLNSSSLGFGTNPKNRKKYNGIEHDSDLDLNIDEAFYRNLDPATGRWWQIDPKVDEGYESVSPYSSMYNDPVKISDPLGDEGESAVTCCAGTAELWGQVENTAAQNGPAGKAILVGGAVVVGGYFLWEVLPSAELKHDPTAPTSAGIITGSPLMMGTDTHPGPVTILPQFTPAKPAEPTPYVAPWTVQVNGNKLNNKPAEGYTLRDKKSGEVKKYGETTRGERKFGTGNQKRYSKKELKEKDVYYQKEVTGTKKKMHKWQTQKIREHKAANDGKRPELNKSDY